MINLEFTMPDGRWRMEYDVHPRSQEQAIVIPTGALLVKVWLGTTIHDRPLAKGRDHDKD